MFSKKLNLNKEIVCILSKNEQGDLKGGYKKDETIACTGALSGCGVCD